MACDENADYIKGQCVCRENYYGDGIVCREWKGEFPTIYIVFSIISNQQHSHLTTELWVSP